jgi:biopolymer transport protein ExbD
MHRGRQAESGSGVDLPVTPMLDMTFQLLFFFIVTFSPQSLEGQLDFALPGGPAPGVDRPAEVAPAQEITVGPQLTIQVQATPIGAIARIVVSSRPDQTFATVPELAAFLQQARAGQVIQPLEVTIQAPDNLKYACLIQVVDACSKAGLRVGFAAPDRTLAAR